MFSDVYLMSLRRWSWFRSIKIKKALWNELDRLSVVEVCIFFTIILFLRDVILRCYVLKGFVVLKLVIGDCRCAFLNCYFIFKIRTQQLIWNINRYYMWYYYRRSLACCYNSSVGQSLTTGSWNKLLKCWRESCFLKLD